MTLLTIQVFLMRFLVLSLLKQCCQVEDCLFRVPCTVLDSQSPTFLAMHSLCISNDGEGMGATDDDPIRLSGVKADGFRLLLRVLLAE